MIESTRAITQNEQDKLLTKQWRARVYFMDCPFRKAFNNRWKVYFKHNKKQENT